MKFKIIFATFLLAVGFFFTSQAQVKIGYTNIEVVLAMMPGAQQVEKQLSTYQKKYAEQLKTKEDYARTKLQEYLEKKDAGGLSKTEDETYQKQLGGLDQEIQGLARELEQKLMLKREELLIPVLEKLQDAIDDVAADSSYTYILNQTNSSGVSTILYGPEKDDLTIPLLGKLNIEIPKSEEE